MIKKQHLKSRPICKLTFELSKEIEADGIELVADFNGWQPAPFKRLKSGKWKLVQEVAPGTEYQFRYRSTAGDGQTWLNDAYADGFIENEYGTANSLVRV
jgi:hypothetical protein